MAALEMFPAIPIVIFNKFGMNLNPLFELYMFVNLDLTFDQYLQKLKFELHISFEYFDNNIKKGKNVRKKIITNQFSLIFTLGRKTDIIGIY